MPAGPGTLEGEVSAPLGEREVRALIDKQLAETGLLDGAAPFAFESGAGNVNFPAAAISDEAAITHGLGVVPQVFVQIVDSTACGSYVRKVDEDQFICRFETAGGGALTGRRLFYWLAVA